MVEIQCSTVLIKTAVLAFSTELNYCPISFFSTLLNCISIVARSTRVRLLAVKLFRIRLAACSTLVVRDVVGRFLSVRSVVRFQFVLLEPIPNIRERSSKLSGYLPNRKPVFDKLAELFPLHASNVSSVAQFRQALALPS